ncbi:carboxymuconolactone decarboxylase family protein [Arthrobacter sp. JZ12]|nr:carboxymuconolactone decarboxylase family protein [Arthrobacter sp. JZ12]
MTSPFPLLLPDSLSAAQKELYDTLTAGPRANGPFTIRHDDGTLAGPFNALLFAPRIGDAVQALGAALRFGGGLTDRTRELVICAVAAALNSEYEWYAHSRVALKAGVTDEELDRIAAGEIPASASDPEKAALALTRELLAENGITERTHSAARQHLGLDGMTEVSILTGYYRTLAGLLTVAGAGAPADNASHQPITEDQGRNP